MWYWTWEKMVDTVQMRRALCSLFTGSCFCLGLSLRVERSYCVMYVLRLSGCNENYRYRTSKATHEEWVLHPPPLRRGLLCVRRHDRILAILVLVLLSALSIAL